MDREDEIRLIAYQIWQDEGCPEGMSCEHWSRAEIIWEGNNKKKSAPFSKSKAVKKSPAKTAKKTSKK